MIEYAIAYVLIGMVLFSIALLLDLDSFRRNVVEKSEARVGRTVTLATLLIAFGIAILLWPWPACRIIWKAVQE